MGTKRQEEGLVTSGGRVLMVVGRGSDIRSVREGVYADVAKISCPNLFCRMDIAWQALR
jgi:phosphoribosylamine--glycine ligase